MQRYSRIILDVLLLGVLPVIVCYMLTGRLWHEWLGTAMCVGLIVHHVLNRRWFGSLFRGKYTAARSLTTLVDALLLVDLLLLLVSGLFISKYAFGWTGLRALRVWEMKQIHHCAGYWALVLMGLHLGQHVPQLSGMMRLNRLPRAVGFIFHYLFLAVAAYGIYVFAKEGITGHLLYEEHFTMTDSTPGGFLLGLTCIMVAAAMFGHAIQRVATSRKSRPH